MCDNQLNADHSRFVKFVMMANGSKYDTNAWNLFKAVIGREERKKKGTVGDPSDEKEVDETSLFDESLSSDTTSEYTFSPSHSPMAGIKCAAKSFKIS